jgi:hypothetical protein
MGICTEIGNLSDDGATWVRTVLEFRPSASRVIIFVGEQGERFSVGDEIEDQLPAICDAIYEDVRQAFSLELDEAQGNLRIGFFPPGAENG